MVKAKNLRRKRVFQHFFKWFKMVALLSDGGVPFNNGSLSEYYMYIEY